MCLFFFKKMDSPRTGKLQLLQCMCGGTDYNYANMNAALAKQNICDTVHILATTISSDREV